MLGSHALLVDDNPRMISLLERCLGNEGFSVTATGSAREFDEFVAAGQFDFYIIDLGLPDGDGLDLIKELRAANDTTPILIITARVSVDDRIKAFEVGADDCLVKPFHADELIARARAILRRPHPLESREVSVGNLVIERTTGAVHANGIQLTLPRAERRLLLLLANKAGKVVTRQSLESALYDCNRDITPNAIEQSISRLRTCLKRADTGLAIRTAWGAGYALEESQ